MNTATYIIPQDNLTILLEQITKLNKRAAKLGAQPIMITSEFDHRMYEFARHSTKQWVESHKYPQGDWRATGRIRDYLKVTVTGESPKFAGWSLMATLEPLSTDDGTENVVRAVPGYTIPTEYRNRIGECDHCRARRNRKETFVVVHDDGSTKMIGRQCIKDFLGHKDPHQLASFAELLFELGELCSNARDDEGFFGGGVGEEHYDLQRFLAVTSAVIRENGWLSKSKAQEGDIPTASYVSTYLHPTPPAYRSVNEKKWLAKIDERLQNDEHEKQAEAVVEWARDLNKTGELQDYLHNVNLVARCNYVKRSTFGIACSMIVAYRRAHSLETNSGEKQQQVVSQHVGTPGKRDEFTVTCKRVNPIEGMYGSTGIHSLVDAEGNSLVWFASGSAEWLTEDKTYKIKATVKDHGDYKGKKQTSIQRVKIVEEVDT